MGQFTELKAPDGQAIPAYLAEPKGQAKGGIVVIQEIFGVNSHIRAVTDGYAAEGYLAIAPAIFHRIKPNVELGYEQDDMTQGMTLKNAVENLPAPGVLTWRSACLLDGLSAAVPYYGGGMTTPDEIARTPRCPVLAHFGDQDHWISLDSVEAFRKAHPDVEVHVYHANHGFNCDQRASHNAEAAKLARERTLAFFATHLA